MAARTLLCSTTSKNELFSRNVASSTVKRGLPFPPCNTWALQGAGPLRRFAAEAGRALSGLDGRARGGLRRS